MGAGWVRAAWGGEVVYCGVWPSDVWELCGCMDIRDVRVAPKLCELTRKCIQNISRFGRC